VTEQSAVPENSTDRAASARRSRLYLDALRAANELGAFEIASTALAEGMTAPQLYQEVITPAMHEIGELWQKGAITVADEHMATALTHRVLAALRPPLRVEAGSASAGAGRALLAAVEGERHALGLRMAADILEDAGFHAIYLGADVPTDALLRAVASFSPGLVVLSATMPELSERLEEVAGAVRRANPQLELLIGGQAAPRRPSVGVPIDDLGTLASSVAASSAAGSPPRSRP
jgi:MerR family transcriptional regulator, light-induced transcriptional regulator